MSIFDVSLETANRFYNAAWWVSILSAALTLLSISTVFWSDSIRDKFTERAIVSANNTAETARAAAAGANERAAVLELEAAQARRDQLTIEQQNLQINFSLENERVERLKLEQELGKLKPRRLNEQQQEVIYLNLVGVKESINLTSDVNCIDCSTFASDISVPLNRLGWEISYGNVMGPGFKPRSGFSISFSSSVESNTRIRILEAFKEVNITVEVVSDQPEPQANHFMPARKFPNIWLTLTSPF